MSIRLSSNASRRLAFACRECLLFAQSGTPADLLPLVSWARAGDFLPDSPILSKLTAWIGEGNLFRLFRFRKIGLTFSSPGSSGDVPDV